MNPSANGKHSAEPSDPSGQIWAHTGAPGTTRAQRWAQLNSSKSISCSQLPPAPQLAKLSWKPCNEVKRCLQMIFWQYLKRCTEEMSALHTWPLETSQMWWRLADRDLVEKIGFFSFPEKPQSLWEESHHSSLVLPHNFIKFTQPFLWSFHLCSPLLCKCLRDVQQVWGAQAFPLCFILLVLFYV